MAYDVEKALKLGQGEMIFEAAVSVANRGFKSGEVSGNTVSFYTTTDKTGTAAFTFNFPEELYIDSTGTKFVESFNFASGNYTGATDPDLNGKPVMVLAVKTKDTNGTVSTDYSFLNMEKLVDTYTAKAGDSAKILNIEGYEVEVKISAESDNAIVVKNDGLYVATPTVAGATEGNIAKFDADGKIIDGGKLAADVLTTADLATDAEVREMIAKVLAD